MLHPVLNQLNSPKAIASPNVAKPTFLRLPGSIVLEMIDIPEGNARALATPWSARNAMRSTPSFGNPLARVKTATKKQPTRFIDRAPRTSANDPARSKQVPLVRLKTEDGQSRRLGARLRSFAMAGNPHGNHSRTKACDEVYSSRAERSRLLNGLWVRSANSTRWHASSSMVQRLQWKHLRVLQEP